MCTIIYKNLNYWVKSGLFTIIFITYLSTAIVYLPLMLQEKKLLKLNVIMDNHFSLRDTLLSILI
jgi:hypothetical protein